MNTNNVAGVIGYAAFLFSFILIMFTDVCDPRQSLDMYSGVMCRCAFVVGALCVVPFKRQISIFLRSQKRVSVYLTSSIGAVFLLTLAAPFELPAIATYLRWACAGCAYCFLSNFWVLYRSRMNSYQMKSFISLSLLGALILYLAVVSAYQEVRVLFYLACLLGSICTSVLFHLNIPYDFSLYKTYDEMRHIPFSVEFPNCIYIFISNAFRMFILFTILAFQGSDPLFPFSGLVVVVSIVLIAIGIFDSRRKRYINEASISMVLGITMAILLALMFVLRDAIPMAIPAAILTPLLVLSYIQFHFALDEHIVLFRYDPIFMSGRVRPLIFAGMAFGILVFYLSQTYSGSELSNFYHYQFFAAMSILEIAGIFIRGFNDRNPLVETNADPDRLSFRPEETAEEDAWRQACMQLAEKLGLTERETEVLVLYAKRLSANEISAAFCISKSTTRSHIHKIYQKFDVHSRDELCQIVDAAYARTKRA